MPGEESSAMQPTAELTGAVAAVRAAIAAAARRGGRDPADVRLVAVTKTFGAEAVRAALDAGVADVGESYVQEAKRKRALVDGGTWHFIGGLQRNKVRDAATLFDRIHTVDSAALARELDAAARARGRRLPVLVQVNVGGEATKRGVAPEAAHDLCATVGRLEALALDGLMTIGPAVADPGDARPHFRALRALRDDVARRLGVELPHLSMGMSDDFAVAVEEGATFVRLGRVLFGDRGRGPRREG